MKDRKFENYSDDMQDKLKELGQGILDCIIDNNHNNDDEI